MKHYIAYSSEVIEIMIAICALKSFKLIQTDVYEQAP
jgi:hypothetical protein